MSKLYATLETSKGKTVSISDNEQITATVYDGNMKAYSVIIEWTIVGEPDYIKCEKCDEDFCDIEISDSNGLCPNCGKDGKLKEIPAEMGAIVTSREWRNYGHIIKAIAKD
jgi:hypothetical protein